MAGRRRNRGAGGVAPNEVEQQILDLLSGKVEGDRQLTPESTIAADAGLDSVTVMDVVLELEDQFDVTIPLDRVADVKTIAELAAVVTELRAEDA